MTATLATVFKTEDDADSPSILLLNLGIGRRDTKKKTSASSSDEEGGGEKWDSGSDSSSSTQSLLMRNNKQSSMPRWKLDENQLLETLVAQHGTKSWALIAASIPGRTAKQCRERYVNQVSPNINKKPLTEEEWTIVIKAHATLGPKWTHIATLLQNRTGNHVKNQWNTRRRKRDRDEGSGSGSELSSSDELEKPAAKRTKCIDDASSESQ